MGGAGEEARARRLVGRLMELLDGNQPWILQESGDEAPLGRVLVEDLAAAMDDLYSDSLAVKRVSLSVDVPAGLAVRAHAAVLRDSVLSNLVNNGIKYSRAGGSLEPEAALEGDRVRVDLRDRGPGLGELPRRLPGDGAELPSRPGTAGESGQGLGLTLAREHLQRMGGNLELLDREGGGTVVRLWLRAA
jgi:signal transduction histidine kinase